MRSITSQPHSMTVRRKEKEFRKKAQHDVEDSTDMNVTATAITVKPLLILRAFMAEGVY